MANEKRLDLINKWDVVNKLIQLENNYNFYKDVWDAQILYRRICELEIGIGKTPTVDAVEVVRCKDCKWRKEWISGGFFYCCNPDYGMASGVELRDDDFCSYGERREGE